jgi:cell division protein ZapD
MRVRLDESLQLVPEISGHRLMVLRSRLMRQDSEGRLKPTTGDTTSNSTLCA